MFLKILFYNYIGAKNCIVILLAGTKKSHPIVIESGIMGINCSNETLELASYFK